MTTVHFEDGPLEGRNILNSNLGDMMFLKSKEDHLYYRSRAVWGKISGMPVRLVVVYRYVREATCKSKNSSIG